MSLDKKHVLRLLDEVANTKGYASLKKSEELLDYVTRYATQPKPSDLSRVPEPGEVGTPRPDGR